LASCSSSDGFIISIDTCERIKRSLTITSFQIESPKRRCFFFAYSTLGTNISIKSENT